MAYFQKKPDDGSDTSLVDSEFTEDEIRNFLCNYDGFSGYDEGFPALYDKLEISTQTTLQSRRVKETRTETYIAWHTVSRTVWEDVTQEVENPDYAAARESYYEILERYNNSSGPAQSAIAPSLQAAKNAYENFSPKTIIQTVSVPRQVEELEPYETTGEHQVWVTYYSFSVDVKVTPRLGKTLLNPRSTPKT